MAPPYCLPVIHQGKLLFDGNLTRLVERFSPHKTIAVQLLNGATDLTAYGEVVEQAGAMVKLRVPKSETASVTGRLLADLAIADLTVEDPPTDEVIEQVFAQTSKSVN